MCISCRPHVDVHKGEGSPAHVDRGSQKPDFCGHHKWMAPNGVGLIFLLMQSFVAWLLFCLCGIIKLFINDI